MNGMNIDTMSHEQAVTSQAAERYLLGELTQEEVQAFEGHYFDCQECFKQVNRGEQFLGHARQILGPEQEKGRLATMLGDLRRPAPAFAAAMLLFAVGIGAYQQVQLADARRPSVEASYFLPAPAKGAEKSISASRRSRLSLSLDFRPSPAFTGYQAQIVSESGKVKYTLPVAAKQTDYTITVGLPASALDAGKYSVVIQGLTGDGSPTEVGSGSFDLQFVD
jgi:hypothetical protein